MNAQQKKTSGCASNLLAHEDLGHLRKPIVGIYKPSSIMKDTHYYIKATTYETHYMRNKVLLSSTIYESHYMKNKVLL